MVHQRTLKLASLLALLFFGWGLGLRLDYETEYEPTDPADWEWPYGEPVDDDTDRGEDREPDYRYVGDYDTIPFDSNPEGEFERWKRTRIPPSLTLAPSTSPKSSPK